MKLTIQIVNFRSRHYLKECLFSIAKNLPVGAEVEIIIVNNDENSLDGIADEAKGGPVVQIAEINKNVGFGSAHNAGLERSQGEYILFLNPDTKIHPGSLKKMLEAFTEDEKVGIVGPLLVDSTGKIDPDCFGPRRTLLSTIRGKIFSQKERSPDFNNEIFETDWVSGGAMLVRRSVFEAVGGFDENYFMYFEDVDLCLRVKKQGLKIAVNPKARVFHESGKSFSNEREKKKHYYASQDYYIRKHFGRTAAGLVKLLRLPYYVKNVYFS
jgi:GT2 family glycosyltransferase